MYVHTGSAFLTAELDGDMRGQLRGQALHRHGKENTDTNWI